MSIKNSEELFCFGVRLAAERNRIGLSQKAMAARAGKTARTVIKYETGETRPDAAFLLFLDSMGADIYYIVTGRHSANALSSDENDVLNGYRTLDTKAKAGVLALIAGMKSDQPSIVFKGDNGQVVHGDVHNSGNIKITVEGSNKKKS